MTQMSNYETRNQLLMPNYATNSTGLRLMTVFFRHDLYNIDEQTPIIHP